jgi:AcrR family transcriptional regulator
MAYRRSPLMQERLTENRERILIAARKLIARGGYRAAAVAAVAREVGFSTGAIYRYFPAKADLFVELLTKAVANELTILRSRAQAEPSAAAGLRAAVEAFASRALKGPHLAYAFIAEPTDPEVEAARIRGRRQLAAMFAAIVRRGVTRGEFPAQDPAITAACIVGAFTESLVRPVTHRGRVRVNQRLVSAIATVCVRAAGG